MAKIRYYKLDFIRGFALVNMIIYHMLWDLVYIFDTKMLWYESNLGFYWQQVICCTFIFLSGFCWKMGKHKFKRGLTVLGASFVITAVTAITMPENIILFGVLSLLGSSAILMIPFERIAKRINAYVGFFIFIILFLLTKEISNGTLSVFGKTFLRIREDFYLNNFTAYLGFPTKDFASADYFPIFPWIFLYIAGYFMSIFAQKREWFKYLEKSIFKPIEWCGKHSLIIYMLHQPVVYIILLVLSKFF